MKHIKLFELFDSEELKTSITKGKAHGFKSDIEDMLEPNYFKHDNIKKMGQDWDEHWYNNASIDSKLDLGEVLNQQIRKTIPMVNHFTYNFDRSNAGYTLRYKYSKSGEDFQVDIEFTVIYNTTYKEYSIFFIPGVADVEDTRSDVYRMNNYEDGDREEGDHERNASYHGYVRDFSMVAHKATDKTIKAELERINEALIKISGYTHAELGLDIF